MKIYKLPVVQIPTNRPMVRADRNDSGLQDQGGQVVGGRARDRRRATRQASRSSSARSPSRSPSCSRERLQRPRHRSTPCSTRKPEYAEREGETIAEAGRPGAVTIATNMAGRGVDIKLGGNAEHLTRLELAKLGLRPGDAGLRRALRRAAAELSRRELEADRQRVRRRRRPVHHRHRAPRVAAHRQPAARPLRTPGRPRRDALLPLRRGRPDPPLRRRPDLPDPRPARHRRRRGQRGADRGRHALQADREGAAQGRGAALPRRASTRSSTTT